ncbi:MAG: hypothetical protein A6D91_00035 [Bacillaceae bacterium G1]|nr:hypothetical protein [Bacillota bacterium]OJF17438.1 MAG: hypothetical protein A6D91_00035 [Bacillaceae bacterium G1]
MSAIRHLAWAMRRHASWLSWLLIVFGIILVLLSIPKWVWITLIGFGLIVLGILLKRRRFFF